MNYELRKNKVVKRGYEEEKASEKPKEIYSPGEGADSPGSFEFERTRKTNSRALPKIFKTI